MSGYIGNIPVPQATQTRQTFTATASQTTFNTAGYSPGYIDVFLNGVKLAPADYTATNGSDVVLAVGAASGDILETVAYEIFQVLDQDFTGDFTVDTDTFVVDSTNNRVGIATSSPMVALNVHDSTNARIALTNSSTGQTFPDGFELLATGLDAYVQNRSNGNMVFTTNNTERMRIDSSGNLLVGKTSTSSTTAGGNIFGGLGSFVRDGNTPLSLNRRTNDGEIVSFAAQDSVVGNIGNDGNDFYVTGSVSNVAGAYFANSKMIPMKSGSVADAQSDLGSSSYRWRNAYLSGTGYVGTSLGVGTSSPSRQVSLYGTLPAIAFQTSTSGTTSSDGFQIQANSTDVYLWNYENTSIRVGTNNTERMRISSTGKVGINNTSPVEDLHIKGTNPRINVEGDGSSYYPSIRVTGVNGGISFGTYHGGNISGENGIVFLTGSSATDSGTQRMKLNSSGNFGINELSPDTKLHVSNNQSATPIATIENTAHHEATIRFKSAHSASSDFRVGASISASNNFEIYSVDAAAARLAIDSSGQVGINTITPNNYYAKKLVIDIGSDVQNGMTIVSGSSASGMIAFADGTSGASAYRGYFNYSHSTETLSFGTGGSEVMRIDANGRMALGATDPTRHGQATKALIYNGSGTAAEAALHCSRGGTSNEFQIAFSNAYGVRGTITTTSGAVSYNTTSDYRLKENVTDVTDGITRVKQLAPKRFNFIVNPDVTVDGFLAHEVQDVIPEAISGAKDAMCDEEYEVTPAILDDDGNVVTEAVMGTRSVPDYQGIDQSKLVPLLTAALQEAIAKIETLETEMTSVKARLDALEAN